MAQKEQGRADMLVEKYIELRDRRAAAKRAYEENDARFKEGMEILEGKLKSILDETGQTSGKTRHGTFFRTHTTSATVADWEKMLDFIRKNEQWGLLERRVSKSRVVELMEERADGSYTNPPPPGVNFTRFETVQIRRGK